jgi:hypothetical protein
LTREPQKISKDKALAWKNEIMALCKKYGIFFEDSNRHSPDLSFMTVTVSIKVIER